MPFYSEVPDPIIGGGGIIEGLTIPWRESLADSSIHCTQQYVFAADNSQATMVLEFNWSDFAAGSVELQVLGRAIRVSILGTTKIMRSLPIRHPYKTHMYAERIASVTGIKPLGKDGPGIEKYAFARCVVLFSARPYRLVSDSVLASAYAGKEYQRFVEKLPSVTNEVMSIERGIHGLKFVEGAANNTSVPSSIAYPINKTLLNMVWHDVPAAALFGNDFQSTPSNILSGVNKVNASDFMGHTAGTLLLLTPQFKPKMTPYPPTAIGLTPDAPPLDYNVILPMLHFDPPSVGATRGHNLLPTPGRPNEWALARDQAGNTMLSTYDFEQIFVPS